MDKGSPFKIPAGVEEELKTTAERDAEIRAAARRAGINARRRTDGYVATDHAPSAHEAAAAVAEKEGAKGTVTPGSDRHKMLAYFATLARGVTLIEAGVYAHQHLDVGKKSLTGWDTGRRRASELAEFGLLRNEVASDGRSLYSINSEGRRVLAIVNAGTRWKR